MVALVRRSFLAVVLAAFSLQALSATSVICAAMEPAAAPAKAEHAHHQSKGADERAPDHGPSHCVCVAVCRTSVAVVERVAIAAPVTILPAEPAAPAAMAPVVPIAARRYTLPPSHAPPLVA